VLRRSEYCNFTAACTKVNRTNVQLYFPKYQIIQLKYEFQSCLILRKTNLKLKPHKEYLIQIHYPRINANPVFLLPY